MNFFKSRRRLNNYLVINCVLKTEEMDGHQIINKSELFLQNAKLQQIFRMVKTMPTLKLTLITNF